MTTFMREGLLDLARPRDGWCVSIYMPTHRAASDMLNDQVALKNLLDAARDELAELIEEDVGVAIPARLHPAPTARRRSKDELAARAFVQPALDAAASPNFWDGRRDGLALFIYDGVFRHYWLPYPTEPLMVVSKRHHITPLVPLLTDDVPFFVLALSQNDVRLLEGNRDGIAEVHVQGMPRNLADALRFEAPEKQRLVRSAGAGPTGTPVGIRYGHREDEHERLHRFVQEVERHLHPMLNGKTAPLILSGVDYLLAMYREVNTYAHLHAQEIRGNPELLTPGQLHQAAWQIMQSEFDQAKAKAVNMYRAAKEAHGVKRASEDTGTVLQAAHEGRVDTLLVNPARHCWGSYDAVKNRMVARPERERGDADLFDLAVVQTLAHGGTVYALPASQMPAASGLAAILRY
ncbi:MAG: hypothetical protein RMN52_15385 [Anaerolineae bacterium]|nr:hypothetical protein [Candidatus Roseilinea sp.]MDW8451382.1 hypothetical protein [Anaerolineae bacterium]